MPTEARAEGLAPGTLSALLAELARAPEPKPSEAARLLPGERLGRFEIVRELGRGGFGVVHEARDLQLGRLVALKTVRVGRRAGEVEEQLLEEAEATARLSHPNIVTLHDVGLSPRGPFLVLELLRGRSLAARLRDGPLPAGEALGVAIQITRGLAHAHAAGLVHRDLTPANVFLCDGGQVKLLDLGLAHAFGRQPLQGGTPSWMAPEQARGGQEDARTDLFALGLVLYRMLAGEPAFPADDGGAALLSERPAPPLEVAGAPGLGGVVARLLAKDPAARPRDGGEAAAALAEVERAMSPGPGGGPAPARRRPRRAAIALLAAALGIGGAWLAVDALRGGGGAPATLVVADVDNRTGDPELDALSGLLVSGLEQSRRLSVLTRIRLLDLAARAGQPAPRALDERLALALGGAARARLVLAPAVQRLGGVYLVDLRALEPGRDAPRFSLQERADSKDGIPDLLDRLAARVRRELAGGAGEPPAAEPRAARAVGANLEAYRHYTAAVQALEDHEFERSLSEARAALKVEPGMALAHAWIAWLAYFSVAGSEDPVAHARAALAGASRLPAKERRLVEGLDLLVAGSPGAAEALRRLAEDYPQEKMLWLLAGSAAAADPAAGAPLFRRALALDPAFVWSLYYLLLLGNGDPEELLGLARRAVELRPDFATLFNLSLALGQAGRTGEALEVALRAQALAHPPRAEVDSAVAVALADAGRAAEGAALLERWMAPGASSANRAMARSQLQALEALRGRRAAALANLASEERETPASASGEFRLWESLLQGIGGGEERPRQALAAWKDPPPMMAPFFAEAGLLPEAGALAARLKPADPDAVAFRAIAAWKAGRAAEGLSLLRPEGAGRLRASHRAYLRGRMLAGLGRCPEAIAELDRLAGRHPWVWAEGLGYCVRQPLMLLEAARCELALGRSEQAKARLDRLLAAWADADPDLPALAEARRLRASLEPAGGAAAR